MPAAFATFPETLAESLARRSSHRRPPATETAPPEQETAAGKATGQQGRRQAGSAPRKRQATEQGTTPRHKAINNGHRAHSGGGIYRNSAQNKTPRRAVKVANRAYCRKAAGIHQKQRKTPHSVSHAGQCYFWSFARSSSSRTGCNRIYNKINGGTSSRGNCSTYAGAGQAKVKRRAVVVLV